MEDRFTILIADRNPHVREYLKREMAAEGYRIRLAENGKEVLKWSYDPEPLDLLILDPDLPDVDGVALFARLSNRVPALPIVIHSFSSSEELSAELVRHFTFVEKRGNSIDYLKEVVSEILTGSNRFGPIDKEFKNETGTK